MMNRNNRFGHSFGPGSLPQNVQRHNLNQLLLQSASTSANMRPSLPEYSRQTNPKISQEMRQQQRMRFLLQKQNTNIQQANIQAAGSGVPRSAPPMYSPPPLVRKPPQYVLVRHPGIKMQQSNPTSQPANIRQSAPPMTLGGQIQLGQTYQFDVKRSPQFSYPGSIILKQSPNMPCSQAQRIPLAANDKGKFIPFSQLMKPGQKRDTVDTSKSINIQTSRMQVAPVPAATNLSKPMYFSISPQYKTSVPSTTINISQSGTVSRTPKPIVSAVTQRNTNVNTHYKPVISKPEQIKMEVVKKSNQSQHFPPTETEPFDWDEYLKLTNSKAVPHASFKHVEISLHNGFSPGMKLEVANKSDPATYWVATLISTCGQLLLLRYDGYGDDRKTDFWADVCTADLHPIGWCAQNGKILQPPDSIRNMHENWAEFLVRNLIGARTAPERLLSGPFKGKTVVEMIEPHMLLEVQDSQHPQHVWMADVLRNVGGRLLLRYKGLSVDDSKFDFWLFYLDVRLHQVGWGKEHHLTMKPPNAIRNKYSSKEQWAYVLSRSLKGVTEQHLVPACVFNDQVKLKPHEMRQSSKLAVLDPINPTKIRPATVVKIVDKYFFLAELDDLGQQTTSCAFLCHSGSSGIFPINWCKRYKIPITAPRGYNFSEFNWDDYLKLASSQAVPENCFAGPNEKNEFQPGMKLEACSPYNLYEICVATILAVYGNVLHLKLATSLASAQGEKSQFKKFVDCLVHTSSHDIFPVGWCDSNNYPLSTPPNWRQKPLTNNTFSKSFPNKKVAVVQPEIRPTENKPQSIHSVINPSSGSKLWCPVVCFNSTCNSGMFINDHALSKVPRNVGPGNTVLVVKEVLSLLVGAAERPHKLLKDLEDFTKEQGDEPCIIKAKFEGKKYQATIHIVNTAVQVPQYFKAITLFLRCCPNLVTLENPVKDCPLFCKKPRLPGRPPSSVKSLTSNRGRKKKIALNEVKSNSVSSEVSRPVMRGGLKSLRSRPANYRALQHRRITSRLRNHAPHRDLNRTPDRSLNKEQKLKRHAMMQRNVQHELHLKIKRRQLKMKLNKPDLKSNPLHWSVQEVAKFMLTTDCPQFAEVFSQQQIDGQAMLLLTLPVIQECLDLKLGPALKVSRHIERVKMAFYEKFANS